MPGAKSLRRGLSFSLHQCSNIMGTGVIFEETGTYRQRVYGSFRDIHGRGWVGTVCTVGPWRMGFEISGRWHVTDILRHSTTVRSRAEARKFRNSQAGDGPWLSVGRYPEVLRLGLEPTPSEFTAAGRPEIC